MCLGGVQKKNPIGIGFLIHDFMQFHVLKKYNLTKGAQMSYDYRKGKKKKNGSMISSRILILLLFSNLYCDIIKKLHIIIRKSD